MKILNVILILFFVLASTSCGWLGLRDRSNDYLLSEETAATAVPDGIDSSNLGQLYPIPVIKGTTALDYDYEVPRPQPASVNNFEQIVKIQSFEDRRWVLINLPPSEVWPRVRNMLSRNGIPTAIADGGAGIIETIGIRFKTDQERLHRFRFSITHGVQLDSTEIFALHHQAPAGSENFSEWPSVSNSDVREEDMLEMLANELASTTNYSQISLLAQNIGGETKVNLVVNDAEESHILIMLNYDRCWASVSYSASRGGFTIIDKNRTEGILYVNYTPEIDEEPGFFGRLFGGGKKSDILESNYRVLVNRASGYAEIRVRNNDGEILSNSESARLLGILRSNLS